MNAILISGLLLVAILVIWLALQNLQSRQKSGAIESQMNEFASRPADHRHIASPEYRTIGKPSPKASLSASIAVTPALQDAIKNSARLPAR